MADVADLTGLDPRQLLTSEQAAEILSISVYTLNDYQRRGLLKATRLSAGRKAVRYRVDEIHRFIDDHTDQQGGAVAVTKRAAGAPLDKPAPAARRPPRTTYLTPPYPYSRADGAAVARPLFQAEDGGSTPTSALHLRVNPINLATARQLVALWHSALPEFPPMAGALSYHDCYVAEHDDHWFAVAIWTGPVNRDLNDGHRYELRRFAIASCAPAYTASRMLAVMARDIRRRRPEINELISYQLLDTHRGTIYKAANWTRRHHSHGHDWDNVNGRRRPPAQNAGDKQCWSYQLRDVA